MSAPPGQVMDDDRHWRWAGVLAPPGTSLTPPAADRASGNTAADPAVLRDKKDTAKSAASAPKQSKPAGKEKDKDKNKKKASDDEAATVRKDAVLKSIKPSGKAGEPARQFVRCALAERQTQAFHQLTEVMRSAGLRQFSGGAGARHILRLNLLRDDAKAILTAVKSVRERFECYMEPVGGAVLNIREFSDNWLKWPCSFRLLVLERSVIAGDFNQVHCSVIEVALWSIAESYSSDRVYQTDLPHRTFSRMREKTILRMLASNEDSDQEIAANVYDCNFPVDIVYTWVNDQDTAWQQRKDRVSLRHNRPANAGARAKLSERFRNRDELRYSFRSVEMFAPFVRKIFLVTDDQTPEWLDTRNPRVEVVSHRRIFRDGAWLPTFNSSGIETQLHHVKGLSEHFLYFNDDFFLGDVVQPEDFFMANGAIRSFPSDQFANEKDIDNEREEYVVADKNAIELFQKDFGGFGRNIMLHVPYPSSRSLLQSMEERYQRHFDTCASNPFRSLQDLRPIAFMQYHYGFRERCVVPSKISHRYLALWKPQIQKQLDNVRITRAFKTFCINDVGIPPEREQAVNDAVRNFLEAYFPFKSGFEK